MNQTTSSTLELLNQLYMLNRNFCSDDYDQSLTHLKSHLDFKIFSYTSNLNKWQIPPKWDLIEASIKDADGSLIYEVDHPLKIMGLSLPFKGLVSSQTLKKHLYYDHRFDDAIPYHFRQFYRPWERTWGFCVPKTFYDSLNGSHYYVNIETKESNGNLKVAEYHHKGELPYTFSFVAHLDHPGMINDDLAGVIAGVELFKKISTLKTKFSYSLVIVPEIIGSEYYLHHLDKEEKRYLLEGCFLEMLGAKAPLGLQASLDGKSQIESRLLKNLQAQTADYKAGPFKSIICNDEYIWEAHRVPMCSLSRFPYPEYHTHKDDLSAFDNDLFFESVELLFKTVLDLEQLTLIEKKFSGVPCLSSPDYNLYVDPGERAFGTHAPDEVQKLRLLMDHIPTQKNLFFLESLTDLLSINSQQAISYLKKWEEKMLVKIY